MHSETRSSIKIIDLRHCLQTSSALVKQ